MNWVRLAEHERIPTDAKYMNPRISFDGLNWWISVCVEFPDCRETLNDDGIGIDLGIKDLAVCSDGTKYKNINKSQKLKRLEKQKRRLQRSISRSYEKNKKGESYCHYLCCMFKGKYCTFEEGYFYLQKQLKEERITAIYRLIQHGASLEEVLTIAG